LPTLTSSVLIQKASRNPPKRLAAKRPHVIPENPTVPVTIAVLSHLPGSPRDAICQYPFRSWNRHFMCDLFFSFPRLHSTTPDLVQFPPFVAVVFLCLTRLHSSSSIAIPYLFLFPFTFSPSNWDITEFHSFVVWFCLPLAFCYDLEGFSFPICGLLGFRRIVRRLLRRFVPVRVQRMPYVIIKYLQPFAFFLFFPCPGWQGLFCLSL